ncbi:hypothetical protein WJX79_006251 [Trebouxia sp. C0005]
MPSQEHAPQEDVTSSPGESANGNKRKAPEDNFAEDEEMPKAQTTTGEGQCGFFRFQDQPAEKARKPFNYAQTSDGGTGYEGTAEEDKPLGGGSQALQCLCGQDAVEITSHSAANPGRVFYKCPKTQAEGRCRFFKWQDELGNGPTAPQQQPGPTARQPAVPSPQGGNPHGNWTSNKSQGVSAAAAGGSGVFADEGDDFDDNFGALTSWLRLPRMTGAGSTGAPGLRRKGNAASSNGQMNWVSKHRHLQAGVVGVGNTQGPLRQLLASSMRPILTARQQRWVRGQEEQHHLLTLVSSAAKLVIGHATALMVVVVVAA